MAELGLKDYENLILQSMDQLEQQDIDSRTNSIMQKSTEDNKSFLTTFYESLVSKTAEATKSKMPKERVQKIVPDPAVIDEFMAAGENMSAAYQDALMSGLEDTYKMREDQGIIRSLGAGAGLSAVGELPPNPQMVEGLEQPVIKTEELEDTVDPMATSLRPKPRPAGLFTKPDEITESLRPKIRPEKEETVTSVRPKIRPEQVKKVVAPLPKVVKENVVKQKPETKEEINFAIFDGVVKDGTIPTPKKGENPINWIAKNAYGFDETDPAFRKAFNPISKLDLEQQPWCAAFAGHVLRGIGATLPTDAKTNPELAFNYMSLGEEIYNHNPTTNKTYAGSIENVKPGDIIVFNKAARRKNGDFKWAKGHISFVVGVEEDGSILALGGNQGGDTDGGGRVQTSRYSPDVIKKHYKGGFSIRRITSTSLEEADPNALAAVTKDIAKGGAGL